MKKNGFTLLEVLITVGIVGIVAAISMPALFKNTMNAHIGASLAKFVTSFETAAENMMQQEDLEKLSGLGTFTGSVMPKISEYMMVTPLGQSKSNEYKYYPPSGKNGTEFSNAYQTKDGFIFDTSNTVPAPSSTAKSSYLGPIGVVIVDINGFKGKNKAGSEAFLFIVDDSGKLIPWGSKLHNRLKSDGDLPSCDLTSTDVHTGFACTGRIADNGWRAQ